jgi:Mn2+/Fe2+ NRAMP family transporter
MRRRRRARGQGIGAGIVAGASDNDPTTVATLAVVGSTTAYSLSWLTLLVIPMLVVIQTIAAHVGAVCKTGLEDLIRRRYGRGWATLALLSLLIVNVLTYAADLEGGGAALQILSGADYRWWVVPLSGLTAGLLVFGSYRAVEKFLRYIPLLFLTYIAAAFMAHPDWHAVLQGTLAPHLDFGKNAVAGALALLGTTLTAYAYVWETIELGEEKPPLRRLGLVQVDASLGIAVAGITFWFILIATGATLGVKHEPVQTAQQAAQALAPAAGRFASLVFSVGLLGSALIALPVLAATSAYVAAEMFGWRRSLDESFAKAPAFYGTLLACIAIGVGIALAGVQPIPLLFFSGIMGGIATPLTMALLLMVARDRRTMHEHRVGPGLAVCGWLVFWAVTAATVVYLYQTIKS